MNISTMESHYAHSLHAYIRPHTYRCEIIAMLTLVLAVLSIKVAAILFVR